MPIFSESELREWISNIFKHVGASFDEAERVSEHLVSSNLMGHDSHGVIRVPLYLDLIQKGEIKLGAEIQMIREMPSAAVIDGNWGFGQVIAKKAMNIAIDKADTHSISCVTVKHSNHIGRLGEYSTIASQRDMIGIISNNNHGAGLHMSPYGGTAPRLSPNPISISFPSGRSKPVMLDMSCSTVAEGKIRVKLNRNEKLPEGWIINAEGIPSTNPQDLYGPPRGAILPIGGLIAGYKGFGLGFILDILDGALSGAGCSRENVKWIGKNAYCIIVVKISDFVPLDDFKKDVDKLIEHVKKSPLASGFTEILIPGEVEFREEERRRRDGIMIDKGTWNQILEAAKKAGYSESIKIS